MKVSQEEQQEHADICTKGNCVCFSGDIWATQLEHSIYSLGTLQGQGY